MSSPAYLEKRPGHRRQNTGTDTPRDLEKRIKLLELYTLHVLPRNEEWDYARELTRGEIKGVKINQAVLAKYKSMKPDDAYKAMIKDLVGDDIGDKTRIVLKEAADAGDTARMMGVLIGSPSFQQQ